MMEEKLSTKISNEIRMDIIHGKYQPRELLSESDMAKKYHVSKAPVKEAMHTLCDQGYLISYPRRGYMINFYTNEEINAMQEIRRCLESVCVRLAIRNASDDKIQALHNYKDNGIKALDPRETVNTQFHLGLAEISGNPFMPEVLLPFLNRIGMSRINFEPDTEHFDKIIDAMLRRNEEGAVQYLCEDIADL